MRRYFKGVGSCRFISGFDFRLLFTDAWFIGIVCLVMTFLTYRSNRQSIREKEIEYAKKGKDTTIDSLNEAKEILSELNEEIKGSFRESGEYIKEHKK